MAVNKHLFPQLKSVSASLEEKYYYVQHPVVVLPPHKVYEPPSIN